MRAIILAAGRGSRLHPYTADFPKCLTELNGESLISRQIATLRSCGVADIIIATGYRHEMLRLDGTNQVHNPDWATTNMVETLFCAESQFGDDVIVAYSDIIYEPRVLDALLASTAPTSVIVDQQWRSYWEMRFDDVLADAESLRMEDDGRILDIGNKVADIEEIEAQYIGLMRFRAEGIAALRAARTNFQVVRRSWMSNRPVEKAYMTDLLMEMILLGFPVQAVPVSGGWLEIDTASDLHLAQGLATADTVGRPAVSGQAQ